MNKTSSDNKTENTHSLVLQFLPLHRPREGFILMGDTSCVIQSFQHSSFQQGDPAIRALTESVSFGRFATETLEWDKWSAFNQNRYLEEAKRSSKPGLVAQKKALFEAHFKKIAADKAAAAALLEVEASNPSENCKPCVDLEFVRFVRRCSADAAQNSSEADGSSVLDISSQFGKAYSHDRNDSPAEVSDFISVNACDDPVICVQMDEPRSDLAVNTTCEKTDGFYDTTKFNHMVVERSSLPKFDSPDCVKTELDELDRSEVLNHSAMLLDVLLNKNAAQEPVDQFVVALDGKCKLITTCSKTLTSVIKPAVQSNLFPRPPAFPRKENNTTINSRSSGSAMLNKKKITTKPLHVSVNLDCSHLDRKRLLSPKKVDSAKSSASSASLRGSRVGLSSVVKESPGPGHISANIGIYKKQATALDSLSAIRKSSAEIYIRQAPSRLKEDKILMNRDSASTYTRRALDMSTPKTKSLHMSINLDSHVGEKERERLVSLRRAGNKIDATSNRTSTTKTENGRISAPANQVIPDRKMRRKQIIPVSNSSADVRKLITQFNTKTAPSLYKNKNNSLQSNSALTLSQTEKKKSTPKSFQMSVDLSSTAGVIRKPTVTHIKGNYCINAPTIRASRESATRVSLKEPIQTVDRMKDGEKCPPHKMERPETTRNLIRPPSPTVSNPFRFRNDERAAIPKEILEKKCKVESENYLERKGKFPLSCLQSPCARKQTPGKVREAKNCKLPQNPATGKAGLHQVSENKISATSINLLPRKTACKKASPNIKV